MKYIISNIINKPLDTVIEKFTYADGALEWMDGLQRIEPVSGKPLEVGAKTNFHFIHRGKDMVVAETVLENNLPNSVKFGYQSPMGYSEVEMEFEALDEGTTKQINNSYFEMKGMMKYIGFLFKGMFKKQSMKYLNGFKEFAEKD